ncbi:MAG: TrkH family potassium uptake protein [Muribaculaceae bacterium]
MNKVRGAALNVAMVAKVIGWLLIIESAFMVLPLITSLVYAEMQCAQSFGITIGITLVMGLLMTFGIHPKRTSMHTREGLLLTALVWVVMSLFGSVPFMLTGTLSNFVDAYFEIMSGFSTTGASVIRDVEVVPHGILIWRSLSQWLGGMGIILFTLAVLPMLNHSGGVQLFNAEVTGITHDKLRPRVSQTAKSLWLVYCVLTVVLLVLLWIGPMDFFDAFNHTMTTMATGGFSTKNSSLMYWDSMYIVIVVTVFMYLCGLNFYLLYRFAKGDCLAVIKNDILRWTTAILWISGIVVGIDMMLQDPVETKAMTFVCGIFQTISSATSTGLSAISYESYGGFVCLMLFVVMIFGASAGSTAGGAKIDRLVLLLKNTSNQIYHLLHPNTVKVIRINGRVVNEEVYTKCIGFLTCFTLILVACALVYAQFGVPVFDAFFTSLSGLSNIGMGYGFTGIDGSFANLHPVCKVVFTFEMLAGRLELFTVLILFTKGFWRSN